ncbi:hypothetical protein [Leucobacter chironomi]|uniref:hypothetical protein n=1 Tax=Leucobacter chironomi TaxID=491918 RepID=UPI000423BFA5|nr:hypothetical protein [Leucobacter chironomi]
MDFETPADPTRRGRAFLVRDAVRFGYGKDTFDHPRWHSPFPGVRSATPLADTLAGRALQYLPRLRPQERFSHATALALFDCPIRVPASAKVDVSRPREAGRIECAEVTGHRHLSRQGYFCAVPGHEERIPVSQPLEAVLQCALQLPFPELVVALDHLLRRNPHRYDAFLQVQPQQLREFAATATGRGVVRFREAAALARVGADSRMETLMRLAYVRAGGGELLLQHELHTVAGQWIGRFDAADEEMLTLYEFDGRQHLDSLAQRKRDARKHQEARDAQWRIMVLYSEDLLPSLHEAGKRMLAFCGRPERRIRPDLARLLDERSA